MVKTSKRLVVYPTLYDLGYRNLLQSIDSFIKNVKLGVANQFVYNIFAPNGFGKTILLLRIWDKYEQSYPGSLIQVKPEAFHLADTLKYCINEVCERLPRRVTSIPDDYTQSTDQVWLGDVLVSLIKKAGDYEKITLLLIDDFDLWPENERMWFTKQILVPSVNTKKVAIIFTSKREIRFTDEFNLRMRREGYELQGVSPESIASLYPEYRAIADEIIHVTGGLPVLAEELLQEFKSSKVNTAEDYYSREHLLLEEYYAPQYIDDIVFKNFTQVEKATVEALSFPRWFGYSVLRRFLKVMLPDSYGGLDAPEETVLAFMQERGLVSWRLQGGYTLNPSLRLYLRGYMKFRQPDIYEKAQLALISIYQDVLDEDFRVNYFIELLYHSLREAEVQKESFDLGTGREIIRREFDKYILTEKLEQWRSDDINDLRNFLKDDEYLKLYVAEDILECLNENISNGKK